MTRIYHQLGHNYKWNLQSLADDSSGDGVIVAARYLDEQDVASIPEELRAESLFDPEFFLPGSTRKKLCSYEFFPETIAGGFDPSGYTDTQAHQSAELCTRFQIENGFRYCVIPTRHRSGSPTNFIESQWEFSVQPFLAAYEIQNPQQPLLLQLIMTDDMLKDDEFRTDVLNWFTGIDALSGIYLIPHVARRGKQIAEIDFLVALLDFIRDTRQNGMEMIVGYTNTEAIPLLVADPSGVSLGSYENRRMFSLIPYDEASERKGPGPNPRIYAPKLLQWVDYRYVNPILKAVRDPDSFFGASRYRIDMFAPSYNWHFQKPEPYKHYFTVFSQQVREFLTLDESSRILAIIHACEIALDLFGQLQAAGIYFDKDSGSDHLPMWITALNQFGRRHGLIV